MHSSRLFNECENAKSDMEAQISVSNGCVVDRSIVDTGHKDLVLVSRDAIILKIQFFIAEVKDLGAPWAYNSLGASPFSEILRIVPSSRGGPVPMWTEYDAG